MNVADDPLCTESCGRDIAISDVVLVEAALRSKVLTKAICLILIEHMFCSICTADCREGGVPLLSASALDGRPPLLVREVAPGKSFL